MTATAKLLTCCAVLGTALAVSPVYGGPPFVGSETIWSTTVVGLDSDNAARAESDELLRLSREAMAEGRYELARSYLEKAERLNVSYGLFQLNADTPAKVRKDLEKAMRDGSRPAAEPPSRRYLDSVTPDAGPSTRDVARSDPFRSVSPQQAVTVMTESAKPRAQRAMAQSRAALAAGNRVAAVGHYLEAVQCGATFAPTEDSPARLREDLIRGGIPAAQLDVRPASVGPAALRPEDMAALPDPVPPVLRGEGPNSLPPTSQVIDNPNSAWPQPVSAPAADPRRDEAVRLLVQAQAAMGRGDLDSAEQLVQAVQRMQLPDAIYQPGDPRPSLLQMQIDSMRNRGAGGVRNAGFTDDRTPQYEGTQSYYRPENDPTRNVLAQAQDATPGTTPPGGNPGAELYQQGLQALEAHDAPRARELFLQAWRYEAQLDPTTRSNLQTHLQLLSVPNATTPSAGQEPAPLETIDSQQQLEVRRIYEQISREISTAKTQSVNDPLGARDRLMILRQQVAQANLEPNAQRAMLNRVDQSLAGLEKFIQQNRSQIELDAENHQTLDLVRDEQQTTLDIQQKLSEMSEEFNARMREERYPEAVVLAKQAQEMAPDDPAPQQWLLQARTAERVQANELRKQEANDGFWGQMYSTELAATGFDDRYPYRFPDDIRSWENLTERRGRYTRDQQTAYSPAEMAIFEALKQTVEVRFQGAPLRQVMDDLQKLAGINIVLDEAGLAAEGVISDRPVNLDLQNPVSLKSALHLILDPLNLCYVVQNDVLKITSKQAGQMRLVQKVYYVADLVIPIPNFIPSHDIGLPGIVKDAINTQGGGQIGGLISQPAPMAMLANDRSIPQNASVLAQLTGNYGSPSSLRGSQPIGVGPGGMGGGVQADFDTLIELITETVEQDKWLDNGGEGTIEGFETNLSLVISQTQEVHEKIADLLDQLRRLQDLQVTIEVRFITLTDNFFERIGVDFDFNIRDNTGYDSPQDIPEQGGPSIVIGLDETGTPTADLDLKFSQDSFGATLPQFGNFSATNAANFGFAILSDIEAFFVIQAAQGDNRTNVLQAPKVTLFNGQQAFISDTSQRPFVTSIIPVVGDFAAAQQPVIVVLSEGTSLSVQAVVSNDRRFVRLTLIPFFSKIGDVEEFTFEGTSSSRTSNSAVIDPDTGEVIEEADEEETNAVGTTVRLPTYAFTAVTTTVSVPDGGTILLGGIKRLSEGRNEQGVPMLSKLPYVNRLFKNVGIGRTTQSLMMMVTPRIIIQEEEEEQLGLLSSRASGRYR